MNYLIKLLLPTLLFIGSAAKSKAQSTTPSDTLSRIKSATVEQRAQWQSDMMKEKLNLSNDQYRQISALNLIYARKMDPIIHSNDSRFSKYRKAKAIQDEKEEKLKGLLTKAQFSQYQDVKKQMMDRFRQQAQNN